MTVRAVPTGIGHYLPDRVVPNSEFEDTLETSDEWIRSRSGIERRHFAAEGETTSQMAVKAAEKALAMAGPSEDNPFLTLKKRLKRARFYDRRERMDYDALLAEQKDMRRQPASAWDIAQRPEPAPAQQDVHRPDTRPARAGLRPGFAKG